MRAIRSFVQNRALANKGFCLSIKFMQKRSGAREFSHDRRRRERVEPRFCGRTSHRN